MKKIAAVIIALFALSSCSEGMPTISLSDLALPSLASSDVPSGYYENLANEYKNLSTFEAEFMQNDGNAEHFTAKARRALRHQDVKPDEPSSRNLPEDAEDELYMAYSMLTDALDMMRTEENSTLLAFAQTRYDCWLAHLEALQSGDAPVACKDDFYNALTVLEIPEQDLRIYSIYFDTGQTALNKQAQQTLTDFASRYRDRVHWDIVLKGYTDSKGNKHQNQMLSMRRAIAVKNMLGQNGIDLDNISISAEGETVEVEEGDDGSHSRRVDVRARPHYVANNSKMKVIPGWKHSM